MHLIYYWVWNLDFKCMKIILIITFCLSFLTSSAQKHKKYNIPEISIGLHSVVQKPKNTFADSLKWYKFNFAYGGRGEKWGAGIFVNFSHASQSKSPISSQRFSLLNSGLYYNLQKAIANKWYYFLQLNIGSSFYSSTDGLRQNKIGNFSGVEVALLPGFIFHFSKKIHVKLLSEGINYIYRIDTDQDIDYSSFQLHNLLALSQIELIFKFRGRRRKH